MDSGHKFENPSPETNANVFSKLFFCWMFPFLRYGYGNDVQMKDVYNATDKNIAEDLGDLLETNWNFEIKEANKNRRVPSLLKVIIKTFGLHYMKFGFWLVVEVAILKSLQPQILREFLRFFQDIDGKDTNMEAGWTLGVAIFLINFLDNLIFQQYFVHSQVIGLRVKVACSSLVYRKVLKLSHCSLSQTSSGEIVNLLSNDLQRIEQAAIYFNYIFAVPLQVIAMTYITYNIAGISCLPSLLFIIIQGIVLQGYLSNIQAKLRSKITVLTGQRLAVMNDIISGIHVIKMYAWEKPLETLVEMARKMELGAISMLSYTKTITMALVVFTERLSLFLTILMQVLQGNSFKGDLVFSIAQLVNIMQVSVCFYLPLSFESYADIKLSVSRVQDFLLFNEKAPIATTSDTIINKNTGTIILANVTAGWLPKTMTLTDVSLNIKPGTLCCVLGKVGTGKTSFLQLLLKELPTCGGKVDITGKISYAAQEPWLFLASVRNNILFGQKFLNNKYEEVVRVCALYKDFQQFPYRDKTMVGERGVSLSGGQRARINLARAVYFDADIYLLDDPLSAVDTYVANHLFEECIKTYLRNKTIILVTHQVQFLKHADLIVVLEEGKINKIMTNNEICKNNLNEAFLVNQNIKENTFKSKLLNKQVSVASCSSMLGYEKEPDEEEEMMSKNVTLSSYMSYLSCESNIYLLIFTFVLLIGAQVFTNGTDFWIMYWSNKKKHYQQTEGDIYLLPENGVNIDLVNLTHFINISSSYYETNSNKENTNHPTEEYFELYVYTGLVLGCVSLSIIRPMAFCTVCLNASRALHRNLLGNILRAPMRFFETNPSGRIMNRFSRDIGSIDDALLTASLWTVQSCLAVAGIIILFSIINPWILVVLLIATVVSYYVVAIFLPTLLELIKLKANNCSPIYSHICATICGLSTVRAFEAENMVRKCFDSLQDVHTGTQYMAIVCCRSFCFYLELVFNIVVAVVTFKFLLFRNDNFRSGDIGMALIQINMLSGVLQYMIAIAANIISSTVSVERVRQYIKIEKEGSTDFVSRDDLKHWPHSGRITFANVCLRYVDNGPLVLKYLNFNIRAGERIGIVGRTGAGKSSLIACLFRLASIEGSVTIDDVDIDKIDLKVLRSNISIIPQEPVLFSTSLRYNIDPLGKVNDETLWKVLENVKLKDVIENLDQKVNSGGSNFSVGQRQLICLARAIVRNNKILIMDEATANVDTDTDVLIQRTIREHFNSCTIMTIAHRLSTIMDSDRVLVMNSGRAVEFAHPHELLQKSDSYFTKLVQETGKATEATLRDIAKADFQKKFIHITNNM